MANNEEQIPVAPKKTFLPRLEGSTRALLRTLSGPFMRMAFVCVAVIISSWLLFSDVWLPLNQIIELPSTVSVKNPQLDDATLQAIGDQRTARVSYIPLPWTVFNQLFVQVPNNPAGGSNGR